MSQYIVGGHHVLPPENQSLQSLQMTEMRENSSDKSCYFVHRVYNPGAVLVVGQPYLVQAAATGDEEFSPAAIVPTALAAVPRYVGIAVEAIASGGYGWIAVKGVIQNVKLVGAITKGDFVKIATGTSTTELTTDGTTQTISSLGRAMQTGGAGSHTGTVWLEGTPRVVTV